MWEKLQPYKKLIYSQGCAILAIVSLVFAFIRHGQTNDWSEQMTSSFLLFAAGLFACEIRFLYLWLKERGLIGKRQYD
ncbi:MAG TPA: hypothetical protein VIN59_09370 [Alphaproteobacteria bacterium]